MNQLGLVGGYYAPLSTTGPIGMAIWQLEDPSSINPATFVPDPAAQPWVTNAVNAVTSGAWTAADAAQHPFWTPDNLSAAQRFGIVEIVDNAPEPAHRRRPAAPQAFDRKLSAIPFSSFSPPADA